MYTKAFIQGGYVAIGWDQLEDLSRVTVREQLLLLYRAAYPNDSNLVVGQQVGQIARFRFEIRADDFVVTPGSDSNNLFWAQVDPNAYYFQAGDPNCPFPHRLRVRWTEKPLPRATLSVPLQRTLASSLTVFRVAQHDEFVAAIGKGSLVTNSESSPYDPYGTVLNQILELDDKEFEILTGHLLAALGFEGSEVTGKVGDGGVDARGELNVSGLAKVRIFVQAKRYKLGRKIEASVVKQLRQSIPRDGQGAFITTADYQASAHQIALDPNFPRIGLINGRQLVDLIIEHWSEIPEEFREQLGLKPGLVPV
ncbi:restriction endonuclease [Hyphomicrobium sp. 99]|uniref:restriction endonuclease n=1 Tax=Hyphomicrobium sp. 99 TaxID=1163419 RepID=UPI0018CFABD5|nr:restriction endonuclease [Hyphomicrobium sp. 99]